MWTCWQLRPTPDGADHSGIVVALLVFCMFRLGRTLGPSRAVALHRTHESSPGVWCVRGVCRQALWLPAYVPPRPCCTCAVPACRRNTYARGPAGMDGGPPRHVHVTCGRSGTRPCAVVAGWNVCTLSSVSLPTCLDCSRSALAPSPWIRSPRQACSMYEAEALGPCVAVVQERRLSCHRAVARTAMLVLSSSERATSHRALWALWACVLPTSPCLEEGLRKAAGPLERGAAAPRGKGWGAAGEQLSLPWGGVVGSALSPAGESTASPPWSGPEEPKHSTQHGVGKLNGSSSCEVAAGTRLHSSGGLAGGAHTQC